jgi:hypothetical protein
MVANDTLTLKMVNDDALYYRQNLRRSTYKEEVTVNGEKVVYASNIKVDVRKSATAESTMVIQKVSRGKNKSKANFNTTKIIYKYQIIENTIVLDAYFLSEYKNLWKDEEINITFYIPENTLVYFDRSTKNFLHHIENSTDIYDKDMAKHHFKMTENTLTCTDCVEELEEEIIENDAKKNKTKIQETI